MIRPDLPLVLNVGLTAYADYDSVASTLKATAGPGLNNLPWRSQSRTYFSESPDTAFSIAFIARTLPVSQSSGLVLSHLPRSKSLFNIPGRVR